MNIPIHCMEHIVKFLGPVDLAKFGSTCKTSRALVLNKDLWINFICQPSMNSVLLYNRPPSGSVHYGERTNLCFLIWLADVIVNRIDLLPVFVLDELNEEKFIQKSFTYWVDCKKPCCILNHFNIWDICKLKPVLKSEPERLRVYYKIVEKPNKSYNYYTQYLLNTVKNAKQYVHHSIQTKKYLFDKIQKELEKYEKSIFATKKLGINMDLPIGYLRHVVTN
jgi:hypothetical protein